MPRPSEFFRALVERSGEITVVLSATGELEYVSGAVERILGYPGTWRRIHDAFELVHPDDVTMVAAVLGAKVAEPDVGEPLTFRMRHLDGTYRFLEAVGSNLIDDPAVGAVVVNLRDVTARMEAETRHREATSRYERALDVSPQPTAIHQDGVFVYANAAAALLLGAVDADEVIGRPVSDIVPDQVANAIAERMRTVLAGTVAPAVEESLRRFDGRLVHAEVAGVLTEWLGRPAVQVVARDLTERNRTRLELEHQATHDPLTGRPNRVLLAARLEAAEEARRSTGMPYAVVFTDLDRFKVLNDGLGHQAGDVVLRAVADRLASAARPHDTVARFGGDEFVLIIEQLGPEADITQIVQRFSDTLREPIEVGPNLVRVGMSGGIVVVDEAPDGRDILSEADAALYRAKRRGRGKFERYDRTLRGEALERLRLEDELHGALERGELVPHVQTEVDLRTGAVVGVEVLCRWQHPTLGLLQPGSFLEVVEDIGMIGLLGDQMREHGLAFLSAARARGELGQGWASVNVSANELLEVDFADRVLEALERHSLPGSALCLELTESSLAADPDAAARVVAWLRGEGVTFAIDDFGTGYASLAYLGRFAPEFVKIDRSFVAGMLDDGRQLALVRSAIEMSHAYDAVTVAEGIETTAQAVRLRELGCDLGQGFLFSKPRPPEDVEL